MSIKLSLRIGIALGFLTVSSIIFYLAQPVEIDLNGNTQITEKAGKLFYDGSLFTGILYERYPNHTVYLKTEYKNGLKDGFSDEYGVTGARRKRLHYKSGIKEGLQVGWFIEGQKRFENRYKHGLLHGESKEWYLNGNLFRKRNFENGKEIASKILYSTQEVHTNYVKKDGSMYGLKSAELCMDVQKDGEIR